MYASGLLVGNSRIADLGQVGLRESEHFTFFDGGRVMLVLSRKENESIEFPSLGVVIRVFGMTRRRVQLGIEAPVSLRVTRGEQGADDCSPESVDSIAQRVIGEEFNRLESELAAVAELAEAKDRALATQVVTDAIERMSRIKRMVRASLRQQDSPAAPQAPVADEQISYDFESAKRDLWDTSQQDSTLVRQNRAGYAVSARRRTCVG